MRDLGNAPGAAGLCLFKSGRCLFQGINMSDQNAMPIDLSLFRKSRIYAEGWKAARGSSKPSGNPYASEPERSRWLEGYTKGQG